MEVGVKKGKREREKGTFHVISHLLLHRVTTADLFQVPIINFIRQMHASAWIEYEHSIARAMYFYKKKYAYLYSYVYDKNTLRKINIWEIFESIFQELYNFLISKKMCKTCMRIYLLFFILLQVFFFQIIRITFQKITALSFTSEKYIFSGEYVVCILDARQTTHQEFVTNVHSCQSNS